MSKVPKRVWLSADSALWFTCQIVSDLYARRIPDVRVATLFPLRPNEIAFAEGVAAVDSFHANGNGSYQTSTTFAVGTGLFGLAVGAATLAGSAMGNAARRERAAIDAAPMWRMLVRGSITVSSHGFYLVDNNGHCDWTWEFIDSMEIVGFTALVMYGRGSAGNVAWRITTDWAELIFVLWALARHPSHPQLVDQSWIPSGWVAWATEQGYAPPVPPRAIASPISE